MSVFFENWGRRIELDATAARYTLQPGQAHQEPYTAATMNDDS